MKKSILPLLIFGFLFLCTKPAAAQNEQLIKEIRNHILKVDSLIACCWRDIESGATEFVAWGNRRRSTVVFLAGYYNAPAGAFDTSSIWRERGERCFEEIMREIDELENKRNRARILCVRDHRHRRRSIIPGNRNLRDLERTHFRDYFKDGEIVAIKRKWENSRNGEISRMTIYIHNSEIIYFQSEGCARVVQRNKEAIKQRHNLR